MSDMSRSYDAVDEGSTAGHAASVVVQRRLSTSSTILQLESAPLSAAPSAIHTTVMRTRDRPKPKVLCLGMTYPDVEGQMKAGRFRSDILGAHTAPGPRRVVECVRQSVLTEMDGRDLARCIAMEQLHGVEAYTCSQDDGSVHDSNKHIEANFNRASFCASLKKSFGENIRFRQIILDYFWIPQGTWMMTHWAPSFFHNTLPAFADLLEESRGKSSSGLECGVIYLPFCYHCLRELVASLEELEHYYTISFIRKDKLAHHGLWSGTQTISPIIMEETFRKQIDQEEKYCTFTPRDVSGAMEHDAVPKSEVLRYLRCIEDFQDVRMIQLKLLPLETRRTGQRWGGFLGLSLYAEPKNGYDQMLLTNHRATDSSDEEPGEESSVDESEESVEFPEAGGILPAAPNRKRKATEVLVEGAAAKLLFFKRNLEWYLCVRANAPVENIEYEKDENAKGIGAAHNTKDDKAMHELQSGEQQTCAPVPDGQVSGMDGVVMDSKACGKDYSCTTKKATHTASLPATDPACPDWRMGLGIGSPSFPDETRTWESAGAANENTSKGESPRLRTNVIWDIDHDPRILFRKDEEPLGAEVFETVVKQTCFSNGEEKSVPSDGDEYDHVSCPIDNEKKVRAINYWGVVHSPKMC